MGDAPNPARGREAPDGLVDRLPPATLAPGQLPEVKSAGTVEVGQDAELHDRQADGPDPAQEAAGRRPASTKGQQSFEGDGFEVAPIHGVNIVAAFRSASPFSRG